MVRRRVRSLIAGFAQGLLAQAPGCQHPEPDPRDFMIADIPTLTTDARTSEVVQTAAALPKVPVKPPAQDDPLVRKPEVPPELPGAGAPPPGHNKGAEPQDRPCGGGNGHDKEKHDASGGIVLMPIALGSVLSRSRTLARILRRSSLHRRRRAR